MEISNSLGISVPTISGILKEYGYVTPNRGNLSVFSLEQKERRIAFVKSLCCPVCGEPFKEERNIRHASCSRECGKKHRLLSADEREEVDRKHVANRQRYADFMKQLSEERKEYRRQQEDIKLKTKTKRRKAVYDRVSISREKRQPTGIAKQMFWHSNEQICQEKLALILSSNVDLMKCGYKKALHEKFPNDLSRNGISFILKSITFLIIKVKSFHKSTNTQL